MSVLGRLIAGLMRLVARIAGGLVFGKAFSWAKNTVSFIFGRGRGAVGAEGKRGIFGKILAFFESLLNGAAIFTIVAEGIKRLIGYIGVGGAVVSGGANVNQVWHLLENIHDPQSAVLDWLSDALSQLPNINTIITSIDSQIAGMTVFTYITPKPTITNMLQITGVGWAFNQLLMSAIQNMVFIFSVFIVRWAFSGNFTFTKSVSRKAKT